MSEVINETAIKIARLNDRFRRGIKGETWLLTEGVSDLPLRDRVEIIKRVMGFNDFGPDNDPYGEHDFGSFEYRGAKIYWKISYYAKDDMENGSEDPSDPEQTTRIMTIMLASEY